MLRGGSKPLRRCPERLAKLSEAALARRFAAGSTSSKSLFKVFLESHKYLAGMGCKARCAANSPCYWQAPQRRRPPGKALARRVGVKSGD